MKLRPYTTLLLTGLGLWACSDAVTTDVVDEGFRDRGSLITPREDVYAPPPDQGVGAELDAIIIDGSHELQIQGDIRRFMLYQ